MSVVGVQPDIEDPDHIIETVGATDRDERLTAAESAGPTQGLINGGQGVDLFCDGGGQAGDQIVNCP